jgi:hypothetical protein
LGGASEIKTFYSKLHLKVKTMELEGVHLAAELEEYLRKRGFEGPFPDAAFAQAVYERCHGKSVLSGEPDNLCIVRIDPTGPWEVNNAVLLTKLEVFQVIGSKRKTRLDRHRILLLANEKLVQ